MSFSVKRVGNFLNIINNGNQSFHNLHYICSIDNNRGSYINKNNIFINYTNKDSFLIYSINNPSEAINKIYYEIESWNNSKLTIYNKKM